MHLLRREVLLTVLMREETPLSACTGVLISTGMRCRIRGHYERAAQPGSPGSEGQVSPLGCRLVPCKRRGGIPLRILPLCSSHA